MKPPGEGERPGGCCLHRPGVCPAPLRLGSQVAVRIADPRQNGTTAGLYTLEGPADAIPVDCVQGLATRCSV
jgi:hypothetical protein